MSLLNRLLYKLYYGKIHQEGFHKKNPWIHVDIEVVIKKIPQNLPIDFMPNASCSREDIAQLKKGRTPTVYILSECLNIVYFLPLTSIYLKFTA